MKLAPQCRLMKICGVNIVGNPDTSTLIGLNEQGFKLVKNLEISKNIDASDLSENENVLINEMWTSGFFTSSNNVCCIKSAYFHITSHCNLNCPGCYSFETDRNAMPDLTLEELKAILDNLVNAGLTHLVISGGEPFSRNDLEAFLSYARSKQQIQYIECITNGTASLDRYKKALQYLDKLTFSLDSASEENARIRPAHVFCKVVENLTALQSEGLPVSIVFTIHHQNIAHCNELISLANSLNVEYRFSIFTVETSNQYSSPLMLTDNDYKVFHDYIMSHQGTMCVEDVNANNEIGCTVSCGAGKSVIAIASDGIIYPCHMFVGKKQFAIGSALDDDIKKLVNSSKNNLFHDLNVECIESCKNCHVRYICGGGCRFRAYATTKNIIGSDPVCKTYMDNIESCIQKLLANSF